MFNTAISLTPEQRLQKAAIAILAHPAYTAMNGVFMIGSKRIEHDPIKCPTAYTNGRDEVYGAEFVAQCSDANVRFLMIHECEHKMRRDLWVNRHLQEIDPKLANMAMDYVINAGIVERHKNDGFAKMDGPLSIGCYDPKYRGWTTTQVFNDLRENGPPNGGGSGSGSGQGSLDEHGWDDAKEMNAEDAKALEQEIMEAVRQGAIAAGKLGHDVDRSIQDMLHPPVDWREALREFITDTCAGNDYSTYRKPHRRYLAQNLYMPSGASDKVGRILCAGDMSGSIGRREQAHHPRVHRRHGRYSKARGSRHDLLAHGGVSSRGLRARGYWQVCQFYEANGNWWDRCSLRASLHRRARAQTSVRHRHHRRLPLRGLG
jgi:predicted metal-dependent peptidase